jgi:hypothetical protein
MPAEVRVGPAEREPADQAVGQPIVAHPRYHLFSNAANGHALGEHAVVITLAYLALLAIAGLCLAFRHGPILLRGRSLLWLNGIALAAQLLFRPAPAVLWLPLFAVIFGISWIGDDTWLVFKDDPATLAGEIETRLRRVLVEFSRDESGYRLRFGGRPASIRIRRALPGLQALTFGGNWQDNRAKVAQRFLRKYGEPLFPRPRFRV